MILYGIRQALFYSLSALQSMDISKEHNVELFIIRAGGLNQGQKVIINFVRFFFINRKIGIVSFLICDRFQKDDSH